MSFYLFLCLIEFTMPHSLDNLIKPVYASWWSIYSYSKSLRLPFDDYPPLSLIITTFQLWKGRLFIIMTIITSIVTARVESPAIWPGFFYFVHFRYSAYFVVFILFAANIMERPVQSKCCALFSLDCREENS